MIILMVLGPLNSPLVTAMLANMTPEQLVNDSFLIVSGKYIGDKKITVNGREYRVAVLDVYKTFKGSADKNEVYLHLGGEGLADSASVGLHLGQSGIWFLPEPVGSARIFWFGHPQRFLSREDGLILLEQFGLVAP